MAAGILASRLFGLVRQRVIAHYFGQSTDPADALAASFRIPNVLQNLFGEGALSASLIPEYTRLRAQGREEEARRLAGGIAGLLAAVVAILAALGVLATPAIVDFLVAGFEGARRELTIRLVRIIFPGVGLLVLSAWCLGILNSHRRFFLSYAAPVVWNLAIVGATLAGATGAAGDRLVVWTAWGATLGGLLQLLIQLPQVRRLAGGIPLSFGRGDPGVRTVVANFLPASVSRGAVQLSALVDGYVASWLPVGAVATLSNAQLLYTLPVSLFGMSVAAAELPALSEAAAAGGDQARRAAALGERLAAAGRQVAFFVVPSAVAFLALGQVIAGLVLQGGAFTDADARWVWGTLAGSTVGLLAATLGRLYNSAHFALGDTRTPARIAVLRVAVGLAVGVGAALGLPPLLGIDPRWGTAGLALGSGVAGWFEFTLLRRSLRRSIPIPPADWRHHGKLWVAAGAGAAVAWAVLAVAPRGWPGWTAAIAVYGLVYLGLTAAIGIDTLAVLRRRFR